MNTPESLEVAVYQATPTQIGQYNDQPTRAEAYSFGSPGIQLTQTTARGVPERARALVVRSRFENRHNRANRIILARSLLARHGAYSSGAAIASSGGRS